MVAQSNNDKLVNLFFQYLDNLSVAPVTYKQYRSDLVHFSGWLMLKIRSHGSYAESLSETTVFITKKTAEEYRSFLSQNRVPISTINRRLSTLRHLGKFLLASQVLDYNFTEGIQNFSLQKHNENKLVDEFKHHLVKERVSNNTIKNYLSDIKQFLAWIENQPTSTNI